MLRRVVQRVRVTPRGRVAGSVEIMTFAWQLTEPVSLFEKKYGSYPKYASPNSVGMVPEIEFSFSLDGMGRG